jgi:hypothetical protein
MRGTVWPPSRPDAAPRPFERLTRLELLVMATKLRDGRRRTVRVALRARSLRDMWGMLGVCNELADLGDDVDAALDRC